MAQTSNESLTQIAHQLSRIAKAMEEISGDLSEMNDRFDSVVSGYNPGHGRDRVHFINTYDESRSD